LSAPIINRGGDSLRKWLNFRLSRARDLDLDLGSGHTAYCHASVVDLYLYIPNLIKMEETFCGPRGYLLSTSKSLDTKTTTKIKKKYGPDKL